jgi:hypothetical protein
MEHGPSRDGNSRWADKEITRLLWDLKLHYCFHKVPPLRTFLRKISPSHNLVWHAEDIGGPERDSEGNTWTRQKVTRRVDKIT